MTCSKKDDYGYQVADGEVKLTVTYGNAQLGSSVVLLDGEELGAGTSIDDLPIGNGSDVSGKTLRIVSMVTDVNPATNLVIITYDLEGGAAPQTDSQECTVDASGDSAFFEANYSLTS